MGILKSNTRGKAYTRYQRNRTINRKINILRKKNGDLFLKDFFPIKGKLSKGKIHCSCYMCRSKSYDILSHRDNSKLIYDLKEINDYLSGDY